MERTIIITSLTVIITLILNKFLGNFIFGVFIFLLKPFKKGDRVTISNVRGDLVTGEVIKKTFLNVHIMDYERNVHIVPNMIFEENVIVNSDIKEGVNNINHIRLSFDSNIEKAENIIKKILIEDKETINNKDNTILVLKTDDGGLIIEYNVRNSRDKADAFILSSEIKKKIILQFQKERDIKMI